MSVSKCFSSASFWVPEWNPPITAWTEHSPFAFWMVEALKPRRIVELGTHAGYSYLVFCQAVKKLGLFTECTAVDTWQGDHQAGLYGDDILRNLQSHHDPRYGHFSRLLKSTFDEAIHRFADGSIDLLHIDGLHAYEAVKHDFLLWLPKLSRRGVIIFHDTAERKADFGVWQLWAEVSRRYPHFEFTHGHGLGVLAVGKEVPRFLRALTELSEADAEMVRHLYERLGKALYALFPDASAPPKPRSARPGSREKVLQNELRTLQKVVRSANAWQRRSWFKRAFHRWRPPLISPLKSDGSPPVKTKKAESSSLTQRMLTIFRDDYYLAKNPAAAQSSLSPLEHYRTFGWQENFSPHPLFDGPWYLRQNPDVTGEPLKHYLLHGWRERRRPHPYFDPGYYLERHPSCLDKDLEPLGHYLRWGWKKDWLPTPYGRPDWTRFFPGLSALVTPREVEMLLGRDFAAWNDGKSPDRPTILLVTHESTRTGAPIILLNLARYLRERYHIVCLDLRECSLRNEFEAASDYYRNFGHANNLSHNQLHLALDLLIELCPLEFAVVNSLASDGALPMLGQRNVPTLFLVHEYAGTIKPEWRLAAASFPSGKIVFPARAVAENARRTYSLLQESQIAIIPQGISPSPGLPDPNAARDLRSKIRPPGFESAVVILGLGTVTFRKGVDLFFQTAARVLPHYPRGTVRFVWIGSGYAPEYDGSFGVYLEDHLRKIAPHGEAVILEETSQVATAYEEADVFFLSSRVDPLPLVAQEAMANGLPVICFDRTTGMVEFLADEHKKFGVGVAGYLDVETAANQILRLIDEPDLRRELGENNRAIANEHFDFSRYAAAIEQAALKQVESTARELRDQKFLRDARVLDLDFIQSVHTPAAWADPAWWYVRTWASGFHPRKPFAGFHPGIYARKNAVRDIDPLVHFLQANRPDGPWSYPVIVPRNEDGGPVALTEKVVLHIHLFYGDMAESIARRLAKNQTPVDLFITVPDAETAAMTRQFFQATNHSHVEMVEVPNRGRDIGPLLTAGHDFLQQYDIIGHVHTKKSLHTARNELVELWTQFLFENTLGGSHAMLDAILAAFQNDAQLGMIFPDDPGVYGWGGNLDHAEQLAHRLGLPLPLPGEINFPVGTFFWARKSALQPLFDLQFSWEDYPEEPADTDGTLLHALERLFPLVTEAAGYKTAVTHVPGFTR